MEGNDDAIFQDLSIYCDASLSDICRKEKEYKKRINSFEHYTDTDFLDLYRFDKNIAKKLVDDLRNNLVHTHETHGCAISPEIMVMATIRYLVKGSYQKDNVHGISQQPMTTIIRRVVRAIASRMRNYIKFPLDYSGVQNIKEGFFRIANFPQCIGAIDCTHVKIKNPGGELGGRHR